MATTIAAPALPAGRAVHRLVVVWAAVVAGSLAAAATAANLGRAPLDEPEVWSVLRGATVAAYALAGAYTWWRRPSSRFGLYLMLLAALFFFAAFAASSESVPHTFGRITHAALTVAITYVFLCFPNDRLGSALERRIVAVLAVATLVAWAIAVPLVEKLPAGGPLIACGDSCPDNAFRLASVSERASNAIGLAVNAVTALCLLALALVLLAKARSPVRLQRRLIAPLLLCVAVLAVNYGVFTVLSELDVEGIGAFRALGVASALAIPLAVHVGQLRGHSFAAASLGNLLERVGTGPVTPRRVEELLREALGDPLLTLALRDPGRGTWVDVHGVTLDLPPDGRAGVTRIRRGGAAVAALIHDPSLDESSRLTEGLGATALMLLENAQLVEELRASRARIVAAGQRERRRLERNLHDGAQQRLLAIQLKLSAARGRTTDEQLVEELDAVTADAATAAEELRTLAHGLYPAVLRERGLTDALRAFALTAPVPVEIVDGGTRRCSEEVEEAMYYSVLEAVQNVAKHGGREARATVTLARFVGDCSFTVEDDGIGFDAEETPEGFGLVSIRDRIGAIGGEVEISSRRGHGATVRAVVPQCLPPAAGTADS